MKNLFSFSLAVLFSWSAQAQIYGLWSTGVDAAGNVLPLYAQEQHYTVSGVATVPYVVPEAYFPAGGRAWAVPPAGAAWIGPNTTASNYHPDPPGFYFYALDFTLNGVNVANATLSGRWATDNSAELWLNGSYTGYSKADWGFVEITPFTVSAGLREGQNTLIFKVLNNDDGSPCGLLVADMKVTVVPEPSTAALGLLGWMLLSTVRGRRVSLSRF